MRTDAVILCVALLAWAVLASYGLGLRHVVENCETHGVFVHEDIRVDCKVHRKVGPK